MGHIVATEHHQVTMLPCQWQLFITYFMSHMSHCQKSHMSHCQKSHIMLHCQRSQCHNVKSHICHTFKSHICYNVKSHICHTVKCHIGYTVKCHISYAVKCDMQRRPIWQSGNCVFHTVTYYNCPTNVTCRIFSYDAYCHIPHIVTWHMYATEQKYLF